MQEAVFINTEVSHIMEQIVQPKNLIHPRFFGWLVGFLFGWFLGGFIGWFFFLISITVSLIFQEKM